MILLSNMSPEDRLKASVTDMIDRRCLVMFNEPGELHGKQFKKGQYAISTKVECIENGLDVLCKFYIDPHHQWMGTESGWGPAWDHTVTQENLKKANEIVERENGTD